MINSRDNSLLSSNIYNPIYIFTMSVLFCSLLLFIERYFGLEWDYHPDARTYIEAPLNKYKTVSLNNLMLGNWFYVLVSYLNNSINQIIIFNVLIYSITNVGIANFFYKHSASHQSQIALFLFLLIIFNPYRMHLAVSVLKDTIIIFGMVYFLISKRFSWVYFLISFFVSLRSAIYLIALLKKRNFIVLGLSIILFVLYYKGIDFLTFLITPEFQFDMRIRDFDKVPNFYEYGTLGVVLRIITWPFFYLTGVFILFSPSPAYIPIAIGSIVLQIWHLVQYKKITLYFQIYLAMAVLALLVSGFTSYVRYALPLITILPILIFKKHELSDEKFKNS